MATPGTVSFHTLGCKLNYSETSSISRLFEQSGYHTISFDQGADLVVINTCSVTDFADRKCRQVVRKALRINPNSKVVMIGCYAQLKPQEIAEIPGVDMVLGANEKFRILDFVDELTATKSKGVVHAGPIEEVISFNQSFSFGDRTRSFLKVQDGCDYNCAFCTIPLARGNSRSPDIEQLVYEAQRIAEMGVKEIVLTGVNIGDYGKQVNAQTNRFRRKNTFIGLIQELDRLAGIRRIRISSIEPNLCSNEVIEFVRASDKFVPHFHLPLQSGSDTILESMHRRYRSDLYRERVEFIKTRMPEACIGVDVITGFPGEGEREFLETYEFIQSLDIAYLHVFTYSERPNTIAAGLPGKVPLEERRRRNKMLSILSGKKKREFYQRFLGTTRPVLFEKSKTPGHITGFTDNYLKVHLPEDEHLINQIHPVRLNTLNADLLFEGLVHREASAP